MGCTHTDLLTAVPPSAPHSVDKPTPDNYTCDEQKDFDKCYFPFMTSALAAQWQGGFCQMTCER